MRPFRPVPTRRSARPHGSRRRDRRVWLRARHRAARAAPPAREECPGAGRQARPRRASGDARRARLGGRSVGRGRNRHRASEYEHAFDHEEFGVINRRATALASASGRPSSHGSNEQLVRSARMQFSRCCSPASQSTPTASATPTNRRASRMAEATLPLVDVRGEPSVERSGLGGSPPLGSNGPPALPPSSQGNHRHRHPIPKLRCMRFRRSEKGCSPRDCHRRGARRRGE